MSLLPSPVQSFFTLWQNKNKALSQNWKKKSELTFSNKQEKKENKALRSFSDRVLLLAGHEQLDEHIEAIRQSYPHCAPSLIYDVMQVITGDSHLSYALVGVPVTGTIRDLLAFGHQSQEWAQQLSPHALSLNVMPYHLACATSAQATANIMASVLNITQAPQEEQSELLATLRESLLPYSILPHVQMEEDIMHHVGTALVMVAVPQGTSLPQHVGFEDTTRSIRVLLGQPMMWPDAVVESVVQHATYEWGASARAEGRTESVLLIDRMKIGISQGMLELHAYIEEDIYGQAHVEMGASLWALPLGISVWEERGLHVEEEEN